jgi:hypothetical protein
MHAGLLIEYTYAGDEAAWRSVVEEFIGQIRADAKLTGKFSYLVVRKREDPTQRVHMPRWDGPETLAYVQSQAWFKDFAGKVKAFGGDSLRTSPITPEFDSRDPA